MSHDLWDRLDAEQSDTDFVKTASFDVDAPEITSGPRIPDGCLMKIGSERMVAPVPPAADAPEWAHREYDEQVKTAMLKLAGLKDFFAQAGKNLWGTIKDVVSGVDKYRNAQLGLAASVPATALAGGAAAWQKGKLQRQHAAVEHHLLKQPEFENLADSEQAVGEAYGTMRRYAPTIAADPIVAKSFVMLLAQHPDQQNIEVIQNLMEAEKKYQDRGEFSKDWWDISKIMKHPAAAAFTGGGKKK